MWSWWRGLPRSPCSGFFCPPRDKATNQHLIQPLEEQAILNFIDEASQLGFPARLHMIQEKATILIPLRSENHPPVGVKWARRFFDRHPELASRFSHHLDQEKEFHRFLRPEAYVPTRRRGLYAHFQRTLPSSCPCSDMEESWRSSSPCF